MAHGGRGAAPRPACGHMVMTSACCLVEPPPPRACMTGPPGMASSAAHWATRAPHTRGAAAMAHAGPGVSPRRK
eukprot:3557177-Alexandrium_andersonii.AAC.1